MDETKISDITNIVFAGWAGSFDAQGEDAEYEITCADSGEGTIAYGDVWHGPDSGPYVVTCMGSATHVKHEALAQ